MTYNRRMVLNYFLKSYKTNEKAKLYDVLDKKQVLFCN